MSVPLNREYYSCKLWKTNFIFFNFNLKDSLQTERYHKRRLYTIAPLVVLDIQTSSFSSIGCVE